ncbi:unnamed protein product, partial [Rotaria sp. Silwood1]
MHAYKKEGENAKPGYSKAHELSSL